MTLQHAAAKQTSTVWMSASETGSDNNSPEPAAAMKAEA
jgi:hypothetical protein